MQRTVSVVPCASVMLAVRVTAVGAPVHHVLGRIALELTASALLAHVHVGSRPEL